MLRIPAAVGAAAALFPLMAVAAACAPAPASEDVADLTGTSWRLVRFEGGDGTVLLPADSATYTLEFLETGRLAARIDCNRGQGTWSAEGPGQVAFGPLALTRAACPPAPLTDRLVKDWPFVRSWLLRDGHLFLGLMADAGIYEFEPMASAPQTRPSSPGQGAHAALEGTRWTLIPPDAGPMAAADPRRLPHLTFDAGTHRANGSGGCNQIAGDYERAGESLRLGRLAGTMMACAEGMEAERAFLQALTRVRAWRVDEGRLELLDGEGKVLARFEARRSDP